MYNAKVEAYKRQASDQFHNYSGRAASAQGRGGQTIDPNDRTLTVEITPLDNTVVAKARVFGAALGIDEAYNTANNSSVVIPESSHLEVKNQSIGNPLRIKGIIYTVSDVLQLAKPLSLYYKSLGGVKVEKVWQPQNYTDPRNFNDKMIKTSAFQMVVDALSRIEFDLLVGASSTMVLTINDMLDTAQALSNRGVVKSAEKFGRY